jgi:5-methylcytosine-specific restriction endonuclease McrA
MSTVAEIMAHMEREASERAARKEQSDKYKRFYNSWPWKKLRYEFLKNKERRCACCSETIATGERIVVDHIKPIRHFWHLRLDPQNLQTLCDGCNRGKGSHDQTNWTASEPGKEQHANAR